VTTHNALEGRSATVPPSLRKNSPWTESWIRGEAEVEAIAVNARTTVEIEASSGIAMGDAPNP
jgi:hypothetical protein